jgi:hypothetical protein
MYVITAKEDDTVDPICVNIACRQNGMCDTCIKECQFYTDIDSLLRVLSSTKYGFDVISDAHEMTIQEYYNDIETELIF